MTKARISEIFCSIQGEGSRVGEIAVFIRLCGCNLKCYFCDTKYALDCSNEISESEIFIEVKKYKTKTVIFTGGEPSLQDEFMWNYISNHSSYRYMLETNGTIYPSKSIELFDHIVVSPKMFALNMDVLNKIREIGKSVEFKFVVEENFEKEIDLAKKLSLSSVTFQPIWLNDTLDSYIERTKRIIEKSKECDMDIRVIPQMHKILYGNAKGV